MRLNRRETLSEARILLGLAWPVVLTSLNWTLLHLIDVAVVGHFSTHELGALGAGRALTFITIVIGIAALSGILVFCSRADGAGAARRCGDYLRSGLLLGFVMGVACMIVLLVWAKPLIQLIGVSAALADDGARVVRAMALAYPPQLVMTAAAFFLEGVSRPRPAMVVNMVMLPFNAVLAWAWVGGHFGLPEMGAAGAALATAVVSLFGAAAMLGAAWILPRARELDVHDLSLAAWRRAVRGVPALFRFGLVPGIASGLELAGFSWLIALSTQLGDVTAAAFQTVFSLHNFAFAFALGMGSAAGVRVGNAVGAGNPGVAMQRSLLAAAMAVLSMGLIAAIYMLTDEPLVSLFSNDAEVILSAAGMLLLFAPWMMFDGVQIVFVYALRSMGDQVAAGVNGVIAFFLVTGGLGWLLVRLGYGSDALIYGSAAGMVAAAVLQSARMWWISRRGVPRTTA